MAPSDTESSVENLYKLGPLQYILIGGGLALAALLLVLATAYSADPDAGAPIFTDNPANGGGDPNDPNNGETELNINPVEAFLPQSGEGSTCTEPVGVDLIPGYGATLTINGVAIAEDEINGASGVATAGSSLGEVSWGPEEGCPRGEILRPQGNRLEACVYRNLDGPGTCTTYVHTFDAL